MRDFIGMLDDAIEDWASLGATSSLRRREGDFWAEYWVLWQEQYDASQQYRQ